MKPSAMKQNATEVTIYITVKKKQKSVCEIAPWKILRMC